MESAYLTSRVATAALIRDAARFLAGRPAAEVAEAVARGTAPTLVEFVARVAARFNVAVSQKFMAQSVAVIGVATGALITSAFTDHFNRVARFHFGMRKLEGWIGQEPVWSAYRAALPRRGSDNALQPAG